jgi:hypothetical protein
MTFGTAFDKDRFDIPPEIDRLGSLARETGSAKAHCQQRRERRLEPFQQIHGSCFSELIATTLHDRLWLVISFVGSGVRLKLSGIEESRPFGPLCHWT